MDHRHTTQWHVGETPEPVKRNVYVFWLWQRMIKFAMPIGVKISLSGMVFFFASFNVLLRDHSIAESLSQCGGWERFRRNCLKRRRWQISTRLRVIILGHFSKTSWKRIFIAFNSKPSFISSYPCKLSYMSTQFEGW